jgi:hypothetical protein
MSIPSSPVSTSSKPEESVGYCHILIAVVGPHWLSSSNREGKRRLEIPEDSVHVEISTVLKRGIRVIHVLVEGATMPEVGDLPDELKSFVRRNALNLSSVTIVFAPSRNRSHPQFGDS